MRQQSLVSWAGQGKIWVFDKVLLPKWKKKIVEFNTRPPSSPSTTSSSSALSTSSSHAIIETKFGELPHFNAMSSSDFKWGPRDGVDFIKDIDHAYEVTTKWRKNVFKLPSGQSGKQFTQALSRLFIAYGERAQSNVLLSKRPPLLPRCFFSNLPVSQRTETMSIIFYDASCYGRGQDQRVVERRGHHSSSTGSLNKDVG
jgi:hypothetical protein